MAGAKRYRAAVVGGSGYGGAEMIRRLLVHPEVELARVASVDFVGEPLGAAHPSLEGVTDLVFENLPPGQAARGMDVVLLGLPHRVSATVMPELLASGARVVDMSGDFRLRDAAEYERYYGARHPHPDLLATFVYGLPELHRERLRAARRIAAPGCFATTIELALLPLARAGLLEGVVHVQGITGSSGSGVAPGAGTHHPVRAGNLRTYKPLEHQHLPEIAQALSDAGARDLALRFVPVSAPLVRGILATAFVELPEAWSEDRVRQLYRETYAGEPFVRVPRKRLPEVAAVSGSNFAEVGAAVGPARAGRRTAALFGATDNLVKGGAGQAIQDMNLALGLPERLALEDPGPWPP
ncbi:MAG TPA: N-acetyl-gamma-glutamyl-phosphate reductase [Anaeromyxobacteraceae bacterium]|nr:N-acetyl-gamma-glutamyl-phosphate reductase [Anaeromyxobacteraceae bacterium]